MGVDRARHRRRGPIDARLQAWRELLLREGDAVTWAPTGSRAIIAPAPLGCLVLAPLRSEHGLAAWQLYPGFEEYAVLYGDTWGHRPFPYGTSLPDRGDPRVFRLRLNPGRAFLRMGDQVMVVGREIAVGMDQGTFTALRDAPLCTMKALLAATGASEEALRAGLDGLPENGVAQLIFEPHASSNLAA